MNHYEITFAYFKNITGTVTVRTDNAALYVRQLTRKYTVCAFKTWRTK